MKTRTGFVSNSSSSSFILKKENLTELQILKIKNHIDEAKLHNDFYDFGSVRDDDAWSITEDEFYIRGYCFMDNFSMHRFIHDYLGIPAFDAKWDY